MKIISYIYLFGFIFVVVSSGFIIAASPTDVNSPQKKILLYDFTDRAQLKDWTVESDRICEQKLELVPGPTGRAMRIRWVVKDTSQQYWSILKMRLDRPVNIDEYDCLSFDVKPGPGNVIPAVGLNSTAGCVSVEDNISSFEPTVIPGRWAHVEIDLKNAGLAGAFRGMRFYQGLHWGLTKGTYSLDVDNIVLSKKQKVAYSPPEFEIRSEWNYFLTGEPARFRIANRTKADKPVQISVFKKDGDKAIWNRETTLSDDPEIVQVDGLAEGEYTIIVKDKELELLSLSFKVLKKIENFVRYDWNTSIQANGKYLFPIGLYFLLENASDEG
ncbi:MAG: hypothetical protein JXA11_17145, partial [Phycisphaerae bacterium]|nr:hypothetical protein [Phycisphaerae bacterium]